jgi:Fe-S oxidoreductase
MPGTLAGRFELEGCIQCGRCTGGCPVSVKSPLNIRKVVYAGLLDRLGQYDPDQLGLWECTACTTCNLRCPKKIKPADLIVGLRSDLIEKGRMQTTIQAALESTYLQGNPWSRAREHRFDWAAGLNLRYLEEGARAEVFLYVCCTACYDPRVAETAKALVKLLQAAGVDFGVIGNEESCCGSEIVRLGEHGLFDELSRNNLELLGKRKIGQVVTLSPHCYNTFKNEYKVFPFDVKHYTQYLQELVAAKKLAFTKPVAELVSYHDPCFLGKQNGIYDEPRKLLRAVAPKQFAELDRSREISLCCEGGGGKMWVEGAGKGRLAEIRVKDAVAIGARILASSCPFCLQTLEDAAKTTGNEENLRIKDVAELLAEALSEPTLSPDP